jgi:lipopolysaccharide transport system ATP-binding protein
VEAYRGAMQSTTFDLTPAPAEPQGELELRRNRYGSQEATIDAVSLIGDDGTSAGEIASGRGLTVSLAISSRNGPIAHPIVGVAIHRVSDGVICYEASTEADGVDIGTLDDTRVIALRFDRLDLMPGDYLLDAGLYRPDWEFAYDFHWQAYALRVVGSHADKGIFRPPHSWEMAP